MSCRLLGYDSCGFAIMSLNITATSRFLATLVIHIVWVPSNVIDSHRGGLVQNINYFERQEMPNGLTEEEQMLGKVKPFWIPDEDAQNCLHCDVRFTLIKRRHHCRYESRNAPARSTIQRSAARQDRPRRA